MANYKASMPVVATRTETTSAVSFSGGKAIGKMIQVQITPSITEVKLYGDDVVAESVRSFGNAAITLSTTTVPTDVATMIYGGVTRAAATESTPETITYTDGANPYVGFGFITVELVDNSEKYKVVWLPKTQFSLPSESYSTKGESITFGTPSLTASAVEDPLDGKKWKYEYIFTSAADAITKLKALAGIS